MEAWSVLSQSVVFRELADSDSVTKHESLRQALKRGVTLGTLEHIEVIIFFT
jgi:hypothetical protein